MLDAVLFLIHPIVMLFITRLLLPDPNALLECELLHIGYSNCLLFLNPYQSRVVDYEVFNQNKFNHLGMN